MSYADMDQTQPDNMSASRVLDFSGCG